MFASVLRKSRLQKFAPAVCRSLWLIFGSSSSASVFFFPPAVQQDFNKASHSEDLHRFTGTYCWLMEEGRDRETSECQLTGTHTHICTHFYPPPPNTWTAILAESLTSTVILLFYPLPLCPYHFTSMCTYNNANTHPRKNYFCISRRKRCRCLHSDLHSNASSNLN